MSHTYVSHLVHCVFSTKNRRNLIAPKVQNDLWAFLGGIARKNGFKALAVGGTENHVHVLLSLMANMPLAKAMQLIKGASSRWMNETHTTDFAWQEGYGAFTVGISQQAHTIAYIGSQPEHHRKRSFEEEFIARVPGVKNAGLLSDGPSGTCVRARCQNRIRFQVASKSEARSPVGPLKITAGSLTGCFTQNPIRVP